MKVDWDVVEIMRRRALKQCKPGDAVLMDWLPGPEPATVIAVVDPIHCLYYIETEDGTRASAFNIELIDARA